MKKTQDTKKATLSRQAVKTIINSIISTNNLNNETIDNDMFDDTKVIKTYNNDKSIVIKELVNKMTGEKTSIYVRINGVKVLTFHQTFTNKDLYTIKA